MARCSRCAGKRSSSTAAPNRSRRCNPEWIFAETSGRARMMAVDQRPCLSDLYNPESSTDLQGNMSDRFKSLVVSGRLVRYIHGGEGTPAVVVDQGQGLSIERTP